MFYFININVFFATTVLFVSLNFIPVGVSFTIGFLVFLIFLLFHLWFVHKCGIEAIKTARNPNTKVAPFTREEWLEHLYGTLEDVQNDGNAMVGFASLILFSILETMSAIGQRKNDPRFTDVQQAGPVSYSFFLIVTCILGLFALRRLIAAQLKVKTEQKEQFGTIQTNSFGTVDLYLTFLIMCFLLVAAFHVFLTAILSSSPSILFVPALVIFIIPAFIGLVDAFFDNSYLKFCKTIFCLNLPSKKSK